MTSVTRPRRTALILVLAVLAAVLAGVAASLLRPGAAPVAEQASAADPVVLPAAIHLPEEPRVLVFGDSWTYGSAATPIEMGYAYRLADLLHGETVVDGFRGSGYIRVDRPRFGERIAALDPAADYDLIILQGSINDRLTDLAGYPAAVNAAWDQLAATYPDVPVVVLGPAPQVLPVQAATARIDRLLASLAAQRQWWYISPVREGWITKDNYLDVIDTSEVGADHPSVEGHAYLAQRVADALAEITDPAMTVEASEERSTD
ncbi:SGNH/GDSL hydrolase family protein [Microbacterium phosphatis]|uniref:SGNH/GDSL hydrolase family protein n=1 Tax=Microbacterium phosphatis TaxID=3140248 RepID=UPI00313FFCD3